MLYDAYELQRNLLAGASAWANASAEFLNNPANPFSYLGGGPVLASALDVFAHAAAPRGKPPFNLPFTEIDGKQVAVTERIECRSEEHTSALQSLMRISYAVFCLKNKNMHYNISIYSMKNHKYLIILL